MKSFEEAFQILLQTADYYIDKYCKENGQIRSNISAYVQNKTYSLLRFFPISYEQTKVSGETGYEYAMEFKRSIVKIKNSFSNDTHELIKYLFTQHPKPDQSNSNFDKVIWRAIRMMAGFTKVHINYLSEQYLNVYKPNRNDYRFIGNRTSDDDILEAKERSKYIIHEAITGKYHKITIECLNDMELSTKDSNTILKTPRAYCEIFDCGELLLNTLEAILNPDRNLNPIRNDGNNK